MTDRLPVSDVAMSSPKPETSDRYRLNVRAGIVCRAEDRGLGILTHDAYWALGFDRAAVINYTVDDDRFPLNLDRFPDATLLQCEMRNGRLLDEDECRDWLRGLDVVYMAETAYDWRFLTWARAEGVATVIHGMPEYTPHAAGRDFPHPDVWWWPTPWRTDGLVPSGPVVPIPAPLHAPAETTAQWHDGDPLVLSHVVGHRSARDRNGTSEILRAVRYLRSGIGLNVFTQDRTLPPIHPTNGVDVTVHTDSVPDRFRLFAGAHALLMPRRYGGLCLPVQEAMSVGVPAVMPDIAANDYWPTLRFPIDGTYSVKMLGGHVDYARIDFREMARYINNLDPETVNTAQTAAIEWAHTHSWDALAPVWDAALTDAAHTRPNGTTANLGADPATEVPPEGAVEVFPGSATGRRHRKQR